MISLICGNLKKRSHTYRKARGGGVEWAKMSEGGHNIQTSSYKVKEFWGYNI